jgi:hypothetical protein
MVTDAVILQVCLVDINMAATSLTFVMTANVIA